jgi:cofilin
MPAIKVPLANEALNTFRDMQTKGSHKYIVFQIVGKNIEIVASGDNNSTFDDFSKCLPNDECCYGVYTIKFEVPSTLDGLNEGTRSKNVFISWTPERANVKSKFMYSAAIEQLKQQLSASFVNIHAYDKSLTEEEVLKKCLALTK